MKTIIIPPEAKIKVDMYDAFGNNKNLVVTYTGVTKIDIIIGGKEALEVEKRLKMKDETEYDIDRQYITLHFKDETKLSFRNMDADVFIYREDLGIIRMLSI